MVSAGESGDGVAVSAVSLAPFPERRIRPGMFAALDAGCGSVVAKNIVRDNGIEAAVCALCRALWGIVGGVADLTGCALIGVAAKTHAAWAATGYKVLLAVSGVAFAAMIVRMWQMLGWANGR